MGGGHGNSDLIIEWLDAFNAAGIPVSDVVGQKYYPDTFGNGEAVFESGELRFRVERDRGEDEVSIAFGPRTDRYYALDDVEVAFGWEEVNEVAARTEIRSLASQLEDIGDKLAALLERLTGPEALFWRVKFEKVEKKRHRATLERFRRK